MCNVMALGGLEEQWQWLKEILLVEEQLDLLHRAIDRSAEGKEAALILIKQAVPCIFHLENRSGEKIIQMILSAGAEEYNKKS